MCGIGGFYNCTGAPTPVDESMALWAGLASRGRMASGFAIVGENGRYEVVKEALSSSIMANELKSEIPKTGIKTMLFHTRFATQGAIEDNGNNHPINEHDIVMTHNGVLYNDDFVFSDLDVERVNEVDSEAINAALRYGSTKYLADKVRGSMSIAWFWNTAPDIVYLFTNGGNPLVIARTEGGNIVWASGLDFIEDAGFKVESHFHASPFKVYTLNRTGEITSRYVSKQRAMADKGFTLGEWSRRGIKSTPKKSRGRPAPRLKVKRPRNRTQMGKKGGPSDVDPVWLAPWVRDGGETSPHQWAWKPSEGWVRRDLV